MLHFLSIIHTVTIACSVRDLFNDSCHYTHTQRLYDAPLCARDLELKGYH